MSRLDDIRNRLVSAHSKDELIELASALNEAEERDQRERSKYYIPNGKCEEFINVVGANNTFISLFSAGNGVGKSAVGSNLITNICFGPQNKWFELELFQDWPYLRSGRIVSDTKTVQEKIVPELQKWMPKGRYTATKEGKTYLSKWVTDTGFEFDIMTYNQDPEEFESVERGWIWFDEPPPKPIYLASIGRARRGMIMVMTMTPLRGAAWVKDEIVDQADKEEARGTAIRQKRYITADVEDNCRQHGTRGILEHEDIQKMIREYPEDEREARTHGKFSHLAGRVHKRFDRKIHMLTPFSMKQKDYAIFNFLDPHPRTPDAAIWIAVDRNQQYYQVAELWMKGSVAELAFAIKDIEKRLNLRVEGRWIDPSAYIEDQHLQRSLAQELKEQNLFYQPGSKDLEEGIRLTDEALHFTTVQGKMIIEPKYYVFSTCERTMWEFDNYIWEEWKASSAHEKNPRAKPMDANDHMMENIHRAFLARLQFIPMIRSQKVDTEVTTADLDPYPR